MKNHENEKLTGSYPLLQDLIWITKYTCSGRNILIKDNELFYWLDTKKSVLDNVNSTSYFLIEDMINHEN
jgi:hypothetical protein